MFRLVPTITKLCCTLGFYEDIGRFGTIRKDTKRPLSNFSFKFQQKVIACNPSSTGYIVEVTPEAGEPDSDLENVLTSRLE